MDNFNFKKYLKEGKLLKENVPDNITSVVDDMTITMGEDAFIAAIFKALSLEDAKRILRVITNDNPIENVLGPVTYDWLNENDQSANPQRLGPSSQFTFEPSDPKKDLMIHKIVDEYQEKIFDYLWNYELYRNEYLKEDINYDEFDEKDEFEEQTIDPEDLTYPLESAMARVNIYDLGDIKSTKQFNDLVKAMEKTGEVPDEFFALKAEEQMGIIRQAVMYI